MFSRIMCNRIIIRWIILLAPSGYGRHLLWLAPLALMPLWAAWFSINGPPVFAQAPSSRHLFEHAIPGRALNIIAEEPGRVWFTMPDRDAIGALQVSDVLTEPMRFTEYALPAAGSEPYDLALADGVVWFTQRLGNRIGRLDVASGDIEEFPVPTANSEPTGIAVASNGDVWFAQRKGNRLARLSQATGRIEEYLYTTPNAQFETVALHERSTSSGPVVEVWVTAPSLNQVVQLSLSLGAGGPQPPPEGGMGEWAVWLPVVSSMPPRFQMVATSSPLELFRRPSGMVVDDTGVPWVTVSDSNAILRYSPGTLSYWRPYRLPTPDSAPTQLAYRKNGANGEFWFVETASRKVGQLLVLPNAEPMRLLEYPLPAEMGAPWGVAVDTAGHVWVAGEAIAELRPPYVEFSYLPVVLQ